VAGTPAPAPLARAEVTPRALLVGCALGVLLAAGNVYTGLKVSIIDGGSITAALLGFAFFATFRRSAATPYGALENNITQTVASSAAIASFFVGIAGPVPALQLMGHTFAGWALTIWGVCVAMLGIWVATALRRKLIVEEALPFPTGSATAEVIETIFTARQTAMRRTRLLLVTASVAMAVTWFRDARPAFIPQATMLGGTLAGLTSASLGVGISWSPLMFSTGALIGVRAAASMLLGAVLSWVVLAPWLWRHHIVHEAVFGAFNPWLVWPALGLMVAGSFVPLLIDYRGLARSFRDMGGFLRGRKKTNAPASPEAASPGRLAATAVVIVAAILIAAQLVFHLHPLVTLLTLAMALVLGNVSGRATGETDMGPVGAVGTLTIASFASRGPVASLAAGWISMGTSVQTSGLLWAFKAGHRLGASPRAQIRAQILGALIGAAVVVPVYSVVAKVYGIGTEAMPAVAALSWKATAEALRGGFASLPQHGLTAGGFGFAAGVLLTLVGRTRLGRFAPSPAAMGVAMLSPLYLSSAAFAGALIIVLLRRVRPNIDDPSVMAAAAGGIAGESLMGVIIAILVATGRL
jgi:putative OPT family oligopeptide transporter